MNTTTLPEVQRLLDALTAISTRASNAPNDDADVAGQEFTKIMHMAREARLRFEQNAEPNTHIDAAAPDMLEALEHILRACSKEDTAAISVIRHYAQTAIAKATKA